MSEITTSNANDENTMQVQLQILQQIFSAAETESRARGIGSPTYSIVGGHNEQENLRSRNQSGDRPIRKVKVQVSSHSSIKAQS